MDSKKNLMHLDFPYRIVANRLLKSLCETIEHDLSLHSKLLFLQSLLCVEVMRLLKADNHLQKLIIDDEKVRANQFYLVA